VVSDRIGADVQTCKPDPAQSLFMNPLKTVLDRLRPRNVLVHLHLFKNAGTTLEWALKQSFGEQFGALDDMKDSENLYTADQVAGFITDRPELAACSSHQVRMPMPRRPGVRFLPLALVRHPIDRAFSVYTFERRHQVRSPSSPKALALPVDDYFRWWFERTRLGLVNNFHISVFGRVSPREPAVHMEDAVRLARRHWKNLAVGGVVERLDESLTLAEHRLRRRFPTLDLAYVSQNVSRTRTWSLPLEERIEQACSALPDATRDLLWERNREDLAFYRWAEGRLNQEIREVPKFDQRLADFRARCERLAEE